MKRTTYLAALLAVAFMVTAVSFAGEKASITGEVIDSACYIKMGARGKDHAQCAKGCAKAGIPLALLTEDGTVVWLASDKDMEGVNEKLVGYAAKKVTLEGTWHEKGGTKLFSVEKVTPVG
jgi:hypothetical protein